jgi:hypothetical protein
MMIIFAIILYLLIGSVLFWFLYKRMPEFFYVEKCAPKSWAILAIIISLIVWPSFIFDLIDYKSKK